MEKILEFKDVCYSYKDGDRTKEILKSSNVIFNKGTFYSILGPSGSGKTTAISLAAGLDVPKSGEICYEGENINSIGLTKYRRDKIAIIFQSYNLINYMNAVQNVTTAMDISKKKIANKKEKAIEILEKVGLSKEDIFRPVTKLSGGQQQRVAIARAIISDVDLIIGDEPTGNLDKETADDIIEIFKTLAHEENKCVIVVTHSNELARQSDEIIHLSNGDFAYDKTKYNEVNIEEALEFADLVFDNDLDKVYFLRQYIKNYEENFKTNKAVMAKRFVK